MSAIVWGESRAVVDMRRRNFLTLLGGAAGWPLVALAQQSGGLRRIGVLMITPENDAEGQTWVRVFKEELQKLGWTEGRNIRTDVRWAAPGDVEAMPRLAKVLVSQQPDLILSLGTPSTVALLKETRTIPIIFGIAADPIGSGFVASFQRPGGNATGFIVTEPTISGKWVELLKEIAPGVARVAILFNPTTATYSEYWLKSFKAAAASFALKAIEAPVHDLDSAVAAQAVEPNGGMIVMPDPFTQVHRGEITSLAVRYRIPTIASNRSFAEPGALLTYGADLADNFRRAAIYADRVLKGANPGELPVEAPVKFELVINMKTAKALGLDVPVQLQQRADEVIE
jgi:putative tryptophan/tyrosine transport system substrate-binding protein